MSEEETTKTSDHKATDVSFDLSKQFISLAFAGVAFAIGLSAASGALASSILFWTTIVLFAGSALLGFFFMMRGAAFIAEDGKFDIFESASRWMALLQIIFVFVGVVLLLILHVRDGTRKAPSNDSHNGLRITSDGMVIEYPENEKLDVTVNADGSFEVHTK